MNLAAARLAPSPGADGLVCRSTGAVLFVAARTPVADVARLVDEVLAHDHAVPGRHLARQLATMVGADADTSLPGFALVAATPAGLYVKAYGPVEIRLQGEGEEQVISAVGTLTGIDREVSGPFHTIVAHRAGETVPVAVFDVDVQAGSAPGSGFALTMLTGATDAPMGVIPPSSTPEAATSGDSGDSADDGLDAPTQAWSPPPEDRTPPAPEAVPAFASPPIEPLPAEPPLTDEPSWGGPAASPSAPPVEPAAETPSVDEAPVAQGPPAWDPPVDEPPAWEPAVVGPPGTAPAAHEPPVDGAPVVEPPPAYEPPVDEGPPAYEPPVGEAPPTYEPATIAPSAAAGAAFTSQLLGALDADEVEEREALPLDLDPAEVRAPEQAANEVLVQGVICSRGHFNDPRSRFCSSCGISMVQNTQVLTNGPRPPLGVMVFEDGATFSLSSDYVVGRQPEVSDLVQEGLALPLPVDDPERSISRAHAELRLVEWDVHLVNLSATNGSFVWDEIQQQWVPIPAGQSVVLTPGLRVALGRRSAVFESSLVR